MEWNSEGLRNLGKSLGKGHNVRERNYLVENCGSHSSIPTIFEGLSCERGFGVILGCCRDTTSSYKTKANLNNKKSKTGTEHQLYSSE